MSNTHEVNVVRVGPILPHPNADKLQLTMVGGYQVVIGKDSFKEGDLAVYIQPDSVVPQTEPFRFIWEPYQETVPANPQEDNFLPCPLPVPAKRRRITVKRLRKEYSEGLLMPVVDFPDMVRQLNLKEGLDVATYLGITHYVPEFDAENTSASSQAMPKRKLKYPKTLRGWFYFLLRRLGFRSSNPSEMEVPFDFPHYDVNALKNAKRVTFADSESVQITEKIHGSNARYVFVPDSEKENPLNPSGKFYVGSHEKWVLDGSNVWWNVARQHPEIEEWCTQNPGKVLYGEVGPTQKGFRYGCGDGETFFFAFDTYDSKTDTWYWPGNLGFAMNAPALYVGSYSPAKVKEFVDGMSVVPNAQNIREGIVISSRERRLKLKVVSNAYLEKDSK